MTGEFDRRKALSEQLTGAFGVHRIIDARKRDAERRLAEAEAEFNALAKLEAFTRDLIDGYRRRLEEIDAEAMR
jgi:hypothetical protein